MGFIIDSIVDATGINKLIDQAIFILAVIMLIVVLYYAAKI